MTVGEFRARVRFEYEANKHVETLEAKNVLILKWTMELIETHNKWKQKLHVMRFFDSGDWAALRQRTSNPRLSPLPPVGVSPFLAEFLAPRPSI